MTITVTAVNDPPVANAGPNQNLPAAGLVQLTGAASSDPEGQPLTYAWTLTGKPAGSTATLSNATIVNPTFTADLGGTYTAQLVVNDGSLPSAPSTVTIDVAALPTVTIVATTPNASGDGTGERRVHVHPHRADHLRAAGELRHPGHGDQRQRLPRHRLR